MFKIYNPVGILLSFFIFCLYSYLSANHWMIIANAPSDFDKEMIEKLKPNKILALDGAANRLKEAHILPDVILGDFDSINDLAFWGITHSFTQLNGDFTPYQGNHGVLIVPTLNQDLTDLEKGILFCDARGAIKISIFNATGGRLDHILGNIGVLRKYHSPKQSIDLYTEQEKVRFVKDAIVSIEGSVGANCAILGYPEAYMTTTV